MIARPILFSGAMILALIDGRKTQTRRMVKTPVPEGAADAGVITSGTDSNGLWWWLDSTDLEWASPLGEPFRCPYGLPGDLIWAKETHYRWGRWRKDGLTQAGHQRWRFQPLATEHPPFAYALPTDRRLALATRYPGEDRTQVGYWKRPSVFMPREASRVTLEVTDVRVGRLQDISEADAEAEGVEPPATEREVHDWAICPECGGTGLHGALGANLGFMEVDCADCDTHRKRYQHLWNHINGPGSWAANPWVWALTFTVHQQNVDAFLKAREGGDAPVR